MAIGIGIAIGIENIKADIDFDFDFEKLDKHNEHTKPENLDYHLTV